MPQLQLAEQLHRGKGLAGTVRRCVFGSPLLRDVLVQEVRRMIDQVVFLRGRRGLFGAS